MDFLPLSLFLSHSAPLFSVSFRLVIVLGKCVLQSQYVNGIKTWLIMKWWILWLILRIPYISRKIVQLLLVSLIASLLDYSLSRPLRSVFHTFCLCQLFKYNPNDLPASRITFPMHWTVKSTSHFHLAWKLAISLERKFPLLALDALSRLVLPLVSFPVWTFETSSQFSESFDSPTRLSILCENDEMPQFYLKLFTISEGERIELRRKVYWIGVIGELTVQHARFGSSEWICV